MRKGKDRMVVGRQIEVSESTAFIIITIIIILKSKTMEPI